MIKAQGSRIKWYYSYKVYVYFAWSRSLLGTRTSDEGVSVESGQNVVLVSYFLMMPAHSRGTSPSAKKLRTGVYMSRQIITKIGKYSFTFLMGTIGATVQVLP